MEMKKTTILILAANPKETSRLRIDEEAREIENCIDKSKLRDQFEVKVKLAIRVPDLRQALLKEQNDLILHFSGHGSVDGLVLENETGEPKLVSGDAIANLFNLFRDKVKCVVLNACYSEFQSEAIREYVKVVVGMGKQIGDKAAIEFAKGFYDGLGAGRTFTDAFHLGKNSIDLNNLPEKATPVLQKPNYDILVVDDDENWRGLLEEIFQDEYSCHLATSYKEAKKMLIENNYRLICSNWNIKGEGSGFMTGRKLLRYIESEVPGSSIILITGQWVGNPLRVQKRFPKVKGFLIKGEDDRNFLEDLESMVQEILESEP
jgi:CheY-like chemotaxis protein